MSTPLQRAPEPDLDYVPIPKERYISQEYAALARNTWRAAGVADRIELRLGPALDSLEALLADGQAGSFDMAFIDADKSNYLNYYECALKLVR